MKHLKSFNESIESDIGSICRKYNITNYTIYSDGSIDVDNNVDLSGKRLIKLPLKFNKVIGYFNCSYNQLTTLEGCPKEIGGYFDCSNNKLTSLEGSPKEIGGGFYCHTNLITSLEVYPKEIGSNFVCNYNLLTSLKGGPKEINGDFTCSYNKLTTLEGGPTRVGDDFYCDRNPLPDIILNSKYLKQILLEGDDFYIWKNGKLDMSSFEYMIDIFKDEDI